MKTGIKPAVASAEDSTAKPANATTAPASSPPTKATSPEETQSRPPTAATATTRDPIAIVFDADVTKQNRKCNTCNKLSRCGEYKLCGRCKTIAYCDKECAQLDWKEHRKNCTAEPAPPVRQPCTLLEDSATASSSFDDVELNRPYRYILFKPTSSKMPTREELLESVVGLDNEADFDIYVAQREVLEDGSHCEQVICDRYGWPSGRIGRYVTSEVCYLQEKE